MLTLWITVPGGTLSQEGDGPHKTDACIFNTPDEINMEIMKSWEQVFIKLMRRYKYLEKIFQVKQTVFIILLFVYILTLHILIYFINVYVPEFFTKSVFMSRMSI